MICHGPDPGVQKKKKQWERNVSKMSFDPSNQENISNITVSSAYPSQNGKAQYKAKHRCLEVGKEEPVYFSRR